MNIEDKVRETLDSGVEPITLAYETVYNCSMQDPIAFRTKLILNSITLGELGPESYGITAEQSERASRLADINFELIRRKIEEFSANGTKFQWISAKCDPTLLLNGDLPQRLESLMGGDKKKLAKICVEFPDSILYTDPADFREKLLDLQACGVNTLVHGFGSGFCPVMRLALFPFMFVAFDPEQTELMQNSEGSKTAQAMVDYVNGLHAEVIACGLKDPAGSAPWYKCNAFGFTLENDYKKMEFDEDGEDPT